MTVVTLWSNTGPSRAPMGRVIAVGTDVRLDGVPAAHAEFLRTNPIVVGSRRWTMADGEAWAALLPVLYRSGYHSAVVERT
jgi:hypothetical protein